ncbi:TRIC cation channel family protein [Uliginosibacterium gangwonense]|uniref:TRIC cation channel family protein n=1 Tax=Uliginosibacterium gangwonense TaxID=392736 RepID=UPI000381ECBA|nr:TRIC cation channel family protein [Uliginosibacterium gangwonense]
MLRKFTLLFLVACLTACGGGVIDILIGKTLMIYSINAPSQAQVQSIVNVTAKAISSGDIADNDLEWTWDQKSGSGITEATQDQVGHSSTLHFRAPSSSGNIRLRVTVKGKGLSDSQEFTIYVYD